MSNRSTVEVFDIVKEYHYLYNKGGWCKHMCIAALNAFRDGRISKEEKVILVTLIKREMQRYADFYIPKWKNFKVDENTTLSDVILESLRHKNYDRLSDMDVCRMVQEAIPNWWDTFYEELRLMEESGND